MRALIVGAGPQGRITLDVLRAGGFHRSIAFVDDDARLWGQEINGTPVVGGLEYALQQDSASLKMVVALGNPIVRLALADRIRERGVRLLNAVHPSAVIMPSARIGEGDMVFAGAVVNSDSRVGDSVIVNTAAVVEHDCAIGDGATICPGAQLGGRVRVGRGAFVGTGAIVLPRVVIGAGSVVGAGALVTRDVPDRVLVLGAPARFVERVGDDFDWRRLL